ncbi:MAG: hypothetical protein ACODAC_04835, partial [Pseudomonadota bacterium]
GGVPLWIGGYSFGAWIAWQALGRTAGVERALLVAPPLGALDFSRQAGSAAVDVFAGERDAFIDHDALAAWEGVTVHRIAGADHFFGTRMRALAAAIRDTLP